MKEGGQIRVRDGFGQYQGRQEPMPPPQDWLLRHLAFFAQILKETCQQPDFGINSRGGEVRGLRGTDKGGNVLGSRLGEVRGEYHGALSRHLAAQRRERGDHGGESRVGALLCREEQQVLVDTMLIRHTETRKARLILGSQRAIHWGDLLESMA